MSFELTEDHLALQQSARDFALEQIAPHAAAWDEEKHFPVETLRAAAALGMGGIYISEEVGGSGLARLDAAVIFEALAYACPTTAAYLSIHNMVASVIDRYGSMEQRQAWVPGLCSMELMASYCLTEPAAGSDAAALKTRARREGDSYVLNGSKQFISGAGATDLYLVMARTSDDAAKGISAFIIPKDTPGLSFGANEKKMGWNAQPTRAVNFQDLRVPAANRIGEEGLGFKIALSALDGGRLNIAACSLGGAQSALDKAVTYLGERQAFGKKLGEFQALQFRVAEMATALEVARTFLWRAASKLDAKALDATTFCAMAKLHVTDSAFNVANDALQLLGGYGYLADYGIEKLVRDLRVHQILEGTNEIMRLIIARALLGQR